MADELPEILPEIRIKLIVRRHATIHDLLDVPETVDAEFLCELQKELRKEDWWDLDLDADARLGQILSSFSGHKRTLLTTDALAWRLAACYEELKGGGEPELKFVKDKGSDWTALMIVSSCFIRMSRAMKPLLEIQFRVLSGKFGGLTFWQLIPWAWFVSKLGRELGGGTREHRYPDFRELSGFWLVGKIDTSDPANPKLTDFRAPPGVLEHNRDLRKARKEPCTLKFTHACHECWVGSLEVVPLKYGPSGCGARRRDVNKPFDIHKRPTHPLHYAPRRCSNCRKPDVPFEPSQRSRYCVHCQAEFIRAYGRF